MKLRYGFKAECQRQTLALRDEFGVGIMEPFDPDRYFCEYGVPVQLLSRVDIAYPGPPFDTPDFISGALIPCDTGFVVLDNDYQAPVRRRSTKAHEIGHHYLEHIFPVSITIDSHSCGIGDVQELEATEFSGELLLPSKSARICAAKGLTDMQIAHQFGISAQFANWRMSVSGARRNNRKTMNANNSKGKTTHLNQKGSHFGTAMQLPSRSAVSMPGKDKEQTLFSFLTDGTQDW